MRNTSMTSLFKHQPTRGRHDGGRSASHTNPVLRRTTGHPATRPGRRSPKHAPHAPLASPRTLAAAPGGLARPRPMLPGCRRAAETDPARSPPGPPPLGRSGPRGESPRTMLRRLTGAAGPQSPHGAEGSPLRGGPLRPAAPSPVLSLGQAAPRPQIRVELGDVRPLVLQGSRRPPHRDRGGAGVGVTVAVTRELSPAGAPGRTLRSRSAGVPARDGSVRDRYGAGGCTPPQWAGSRGGRLSRGSAEVKLPLPADSAARHRAGDAHQRGGRYYAPRAGPWVRPRFRGVLAAAANDDTTASGATSTDIAPAPRAITPPGSGWGRGGSHVGGHAGAGRHGGTGAGHGARMAVASGLAPSPRRVSATSATRAARGRSSGGRRSTPDRAGTTAPHRRGTPLSQTDPRAEAMRGAQPAAAAARREGPPPPPPAGGTGHGGRLDGPGRPGEAGEAPAGGGRHGRGGQQRPPMVGSSVASLAADSHTQDGDHDRDDRRTVTDASAGVTVETSVGDARSAASRGDHDAPPPPPPPAAPPASQLCDSSPPGRTMPPGAQLVVSAETGEDDKTRFVTVLDSGGSALGRPASTGPVPSDGSVSSFGAGAGPAAAVEEAGAAAVVGSSRPVVRRRWRGGRGLGGIAARTVVPLGGFATVSEATSAGRTAGSDLVSGSDDGGGHTARTHAGSSRAGTAPDPGPRGGGGALPGPWAAAPSTTAEQSSASLFRIRVSDDDRPAEPPAGVTSPAEPHDLSPVSSSIAPLGAVGGRTPGLSPGRPGAAGGGSAGRRDVGAGAEREHDATAPGTTPGLPALPSPCGHALAGASWGSGVEGELRCGSAASWADLPAARGSATAKGSAVGDGGRVCKPADVTDVGGSSSDGSPPGRAGGRGAGAALRGPGAGAVPAASGASEGATARAPAAALRPGVCAEAPIQRRAGGRAGRAAEARRPSAPHRPGHGAGVVVVPAERRRRSAGPFLAASRDGPAGGFARGVLARLFRRDPAGAPDAIVAAGAPAPAQRQ